MVGNDVNKKEAPKKTVKEVLTIVEMDSTAKDTYFSREVFKMEEGAQDKREETKNRRDWLVIADIYNKDPDTAEDGNGKYTQKFHLWNYLKFKLANKKITENDIFSYAYIRNAALVLYIREVILNENVEEQYESVREYYMEEDGKTNTVQASFYKY